MGYLIQVATGYSDGKPVQAVVCGNRLPILEGWSEEAVASEMIKRCNSLAPKQVKLVHIVLIGE